MERICIFVDGANLFHLVHKKLGINETLFDYQAFMDVLAGSRTIVGKRYYVGTVRERFDDKRSVKLVAAQTSHLALLRNMGWQTITSKLRTRTEELVIDSRVEEYRSLQKKGVSSIRYIRHREKGIDVKLATDLIIGALDDWYDTALLVSSDGDLIPAIDWVRGRFKKKIEYVGFSIPNAERPENATRPLNALISKSDSQRVLSVEDLKKFVLPQQRNLGLAA